MYAVFLLVYVFVLCSINKTESESESELLESRSHVGVGAQGGFIVSREDRVCVTVGVSSAEEGPGIFQVGEAVFCKRSVGATLGYVLKNIQWQFQQCGDSKGNTMQSSLTVTVQQLTVEKKAVKYQIVM
jgi:hypothetical protein